MTADQWEHICDLKGIIVYLLILHEVSTRDCYKFTPQQWYTLPFYTVHNV